MSTTKPRLDKTFDKIEDCPLEYKGSLPNCFINMKGDKYHNLEVLYLVGFRNNRSEWLCKCHNCGKYTIVNSHNLRTGHTKSCGCIKSPGEKKITELLLENNISFIPQKTFEGLIGKNKNKLRFDFAIYINGTLSHLIEIQGIQHYYNIFNIPEEEYKYRLFLDEEKRQWCKQNNIPLIEIKYDEEITIEKLLCYHTKGIIEEDFVQYSKPTMFITNTTCDLKCERECGEKCCSNNQLFNEPNIVLTFDTIVQKYLNNPITKSITFGGLEQFDEFTQLFQLIKIFRKYTDDDIVIYTGYYEREIFDEIRELKQFPNIIIKYGRFIPGHSPIYDEVLGVNLASKNQFAVKIS